MLDNYKETQKISYKIIKNSLQENKISHAYLIETNGNNDGFNFALSFAKSLLCPLKKTNNLDCSNCSQCSTIDSNNFIELEIIETDDMWIKKDKIEELQKNFNLKPIIGKRKIYIIKEAEKIKEALANKLLKFIEEPEEGITAILITENRNKIINTILSRCQIISLNNNTKDLELSDVDPEFINNIVKFVDYYEENGVNTILNVNSILLTHLKDRKTYEVAFKIILLYYKDVLNLKLNKSLNYFNKYENNIKKVSAKNEISDLLSKIDIVISLKNKIKYNINLNLLIDKLIISLKKVDDLNV